MGDLRRDCIEAGARALSIAICGEDETYDDGIMADHLEESEVAFDAILSVLSERADEWWEAAKRNPEFKDGGPTMERRLLAVLRGDESRADSTMEDA